MTPFERVVGDSSKDHTVTAPTFTTRPTTEQLHHYAGRHLAPLGTSHNVRPPGCCQMPTLPSTPVTPAPTRHPPNARVLSGSAKGALKVRGRSRMRRRRAADDGVRRDGAQTGTHDRQHPVPASMVGHVHLDRGVRAVEDELGRELPDRDRGCHPLAACCSHQAMPRLVSSMQASHHSSALSHRSPGASPASQMNSCPPLVMGPSLRTTMTSSSCAETSTG